MNVCTYAEFRAFYEFLILRKYLRERGYGPRLAKRKNYDFCVENIVEAIRLVCPCLSYEVVGEHEEDLEITIRDGSLAYLYWNRHAGIVQERLRRLNRECHSCHHPGDVQLELTPYGGILARSECAWGCNWRAMVVFFDLVFWARRWYMPWTEF